MSPVAVILIAALTCLTALVAWVWMAERLDPPPRDPPADPDPGRHAARPGADGKPHPDLDALTPGPAGTGWREPHPGGSPAVIIYHDPADTTSLDAAHFLGMTTGQYVDKLFDQHAEANQ